ncbi:transcriptional regulator [Halalkalibacter wakoensis JCM 9140]|uniref:Transcriptional regulator n=1 Tax=Halalkalibacter wakoensis JCM 9140 TaxID=1236970 RepID=W4Q4E8_9BACI|nr:IclR family transcriptional regulator [Halalkalibacter wakoensis]GAE26583.1 transcriptional regulator [Halalkalibacter wakoensis JCM 9140]
MRYPAISKESFSSMRNALRLLNLFTIEEPELTLSDIAEKLQVAPSTAHRLIHTLLYSGMLVKEPLTKMYRPSSSILSMGNTFLSKYNLCQISIPILEELTQKTGETAHVSIIRESKVIYLYKVDSQHPVHLLSHAGKQNPIHCTSTGQVILAYQRDEIIQQVIDAGLPSYTSETIVSEVKFRERLSIIQKQGYAVSQEELHLGVTSIAAPIFYKGQVIASVSIAGPTVRMKGPKLETLIKSVKLASTTISKKMMIEK